MKAKIFYRDTVDFLLKTKTLLKQWKAWIIPFYFAFSAFINLGFYYLGFVFKDNLTRTVGFLLGSALFALLCGQTVLTALWGGRGDFLHSKTPVQ